MRVNPLAVASLTLALLTLPAFCIGFAPSAAHGAGLLSASPAGRDAGAAHRLPGAGA